MRKFIFMLSAAMLVASPAFAKDKPLPEGIKIVPEKGVSDCSFVDIVSAMRFAMLSASKTQRDALIAALEKAKEAGANTAVLTSMTAQNNQHQVTLTAYSCSDESESSGH
jgi:hypothetical protein